MVLVTCTYVNDKILFTVLAFLLREARETYFKSVLGAHWAQQFLLKLESNWVVHLFNKMGK